MTIIVFYDLMKKYQNLHVHVTWYNSSKEGMYSALALPLPECLNVFTAKSKNPIHTFSLTHEIKNKSMKKVRNCINKQNKKKHTQWKKK